MLLILSILFLFLNSFVSRKPTLSPLTLFLACRSLFASMQWILVLSPPLRKTDTRQHPLPNPSGSVTVISRAGLQISVKLCCRLPCHLSYPISIELGFFCVNVCTTNWVAKYLTNRVWIVLWRWDILAGSKLVLGIMIESGLVGVRVRIIKTCLSCCLSASFNQKTLKKLCKACALNSVSSYLADAYQMDGPWVHPLQEVYSSEWCLELW